MRRISLSLLLSFLLISTCSADDSNEVRAVWVTTVLGLDWPSSHDPEEQRSSLLRIVRTLKKANFNTIFFQVRARGDAYYRSSLEPWAENLTGTLGQDPGFDPLQFLMDEARRAGIEVHAWFNLYKVNGPDTPSPSTPPHVANAHPDWVFRSDNELWLNPGIPAVNEYLLEVALELIRTYDVDGIQFDFIRYPGRNVPDKHEFESYRGDRLLADWRRSNIDRFLTDFYHSATALNPDLKIGATPLGNFNSGTHPAAFSEHYQDAPGWIEQNIVDYIVPQIYWDLGSTPADPDFASLARRWKESSAGRHVYAGIGAYKEEVLAELEEQVDSARAAGCEGQAFFRYSSLRNFSRLDGPYETRAEIPPMEWKQADLPGTPMHLAVVKSGNGIYHLEWVPPPPRDSSYTYRVYRSDSPAIDFNDPRSLIHTTGEAETHYVDTVRTGEADRYYYAVTSVNRQKGESLPSAVEASGPHKTSQIPGILNRPIGLTAEIDTGDTSRILIAYFLPESGPVTVVVHLDARETSNPVLTPLVGKVQEEGAYVIGVSREAFPAGKYVVVLKAGDTVLSKPLTLQGH